MYTNLFLCTPLYAYQSEGDSSRPLVTGPFYIVHTPHYVGLSASNVSANIKTLASS